MVDAEGYGAAPAVPMGGRHTVGRPGVSTVDTSTTVTARGEDPAMKFVLEVDISGMVAAGEAGRELGRILRYWAGAVQQMELAPGQGNDIYDSAYRQVGRWEVTATPGDVTG
jgi:hypothetical protein